MKIQDWLSKQKGLYPEVNNEIPPLAFHPINGEKQESSLLQNQFWWSGGASIEACQQLSDSDYPPNLGVISFGPVQSFLGSGQRLRDWAVASWLCHYLTGVLIYHWQDQGGKVLLPLHRNSPLVNWLHNSSDSIGEEFWRAELPNVVTGLFPDDQGWLNHIRHILISEWSNLIHNLESVAIAHEPRVLNGIGWRVIHGDNQNLWSVYTAETVLQVDTIIEQIKDLHQQIESQKIGRHWQGKWWGGRTSPSAGHFSAWHPGLQPIEKGGIWGLPDEQITQWWEGAVEKSQQTSFSRLAGLFSSGDRLNSLEMVKRLASVPEIIMPTLEQIWGKSPPPCPWERFPDRTAIAASWVYHAVKPEKWNDTVDILAEVCFENKSKPKWSKSWGIPTIDQQSPKFSHPRILERRNIDEEALEIWQDELPQSWESTIEWTVGWRGDGDKMGEWLSGKQYQKQNLWWKNGI